MSLALIASGTLLRDPERRTSVHGNTYTQALLRVPVEGEETLVVFVVAFSSTAAEALLAHQRGDQIAVTGRSKLRSWTDKDGVEKHGLSVVAEAILSPYQLEKRKRRVRGENVAEEPTAAAAELEQIARRQAAAGRAQVLSTPAGSTTAGLAEMTDDTPF